MKSTEFIDEGVLGKIGSALKHGVAKAGWLGKERQYAAYGKEMEDEREAATKGLFISTLEKSLKNAIGSGLVTPPAIPESMTAKDYNNLFESAFLSEAVTVSQFVKFFIKDFAKKRQIRLSAANEPDLDRLSDELERNYVRGRFPTKNAETIWNALMAIDATSGGAAPEKAPLPTTDVPEDRASGGLWTPKDARNSYTFNPVTKLWYLHRPALAGATSSPLPAPIRDPKTIETLNQTWAEQGESLE